MSRAGSISVQLPDGDYENLLNGESVSIQDGKMDLPESACILRAALSWPLNEYVTPMMHSEIH